MKRRNQMNQILSNITQGIRYTCKPRGYNPSEPVNVWSEKDTIDNKTTDALVIILRTKGCRWGRVANCTMCGYFTDTTMGAEVSAQDIIKQYKSAIERYQGEGMIKIYTSGSFLDKEEVPLEARGYILRNLPDDTRVLSVESRPEYITEGNLEDIKREIHGRTLEVGIGLETSNDYIREYCINKGFTFKEYKKSVDVIKKYNYKTKTYILVKPLFLTEREAIRDALNTVKDIEKHTDKVSFNPMNIQGYTLVEYLWRRGQYHPPWLWSIVEILRESKRTIKNNSIHLKSEPVGAGSKHGVHNCGLCDHGIIKKIKEFNMTQDTTVFDDIECGCRDLWVDQLELEGISFGSVTDTREVIHD